MAHFEWDPSLETGCEEIDDQHRGLFHLANELQDAAVADRDPEAVENAIYALTEYVTQHFEDEETLMERTGFPRLNWHRTLHRDLTADTMRITARYFNSENVPPTELAPFVADWLRRHIELADREVAGHVRALEA